jgi:hypothetical protein
MPNQSHFMAHFGSFYNCLTKFKPSKNMIMINNQQPQLHMMHQAKQPVNNHCATLINRPTLVDVLCGRGKACFHHQGNDSFRMLIAEHADTYKMAPTKKIKMQVVLLIVDIVMARGGRFLINNNDGTWVDGGRKQGKKKTGHAFRDALRGRVKCITQMRAQLSIKNAALNVDDSSSQSSLSTSIDEFDDFEGLVNDFFDPAPIAPEFSIEPSKEWMRGSTIDSDTANDLLDFFMTAEQL